MDEFFPPELRRNPFPFYAEHRASAPVHYLAPFDLWMIFDYDGVKRALEDHSAFSSAAMAPGSKPLDWLVFHDPPRHTKLRALVTQAFTPRSVAQLEPRIAELSRKLLDNCINRGEIDLAAEYSIPLPLMVIAEMLGIPLADRPRFKRWADAILGLATTVFGGPEAARVAQEYGGVTVEMDAYLADVLAERRRRPEDDLLTRLAQAEVDGARLTHAEILGFFQLLLLAGSETTINLINNSMLCLLEHPDQLSRLRTQPELLSLAIEEVLRYRSPIQAVFRYTTGEIEMYGQTIPPNKLVLPFVGSANRDPRHFEDADRFDIARAPNPHMAFGHGVHFCLGAALSRIEAKVALSQILARMEDIELAVDGPWEPRPAFHVHGPMRLPIRFKPAVAGASVQIE